MTNYKQLLDEVFVISGIYNQDRGKYYQPSRRPTLITLAETLIIPDITKTESNNCFIIHCFEINNNKYTDLTLLSEIMHCACNPDECIKAYLPSTGSNFF